ncbi:MAG: nitrogen fixation protein NifX [Gloeomargarita sp. GMQP_bins_120]
MKVAFATTDGEHINAHFGWARLLAVYEVSPAGYHLVEQHSFPTGTEDGNEDKLVPKLEFLKARPDCKIVYVSAIGGNAAARLINQGVMPVKSRSETDQIVTILEQLVKTLQGSPPPWLRKALGVARPTWTEE